MDKKNYIYILIAILILVIAGFLTAFYKLKLSPNLKLVPKEYSLETKIDILKSLSASVKQKDLHEKIDILKNLSVSHNKKEVNPEKILESLKTLP